MKKLSEEQKKALKGRVLKVSPEDEEKVRSGFTQAEMKAKQRGAAKKLLDGVRTLWNMLVDPDYTIPWPVKAWVLAGLAYFISPIDAIPDVIPVLGYVDDAAVIAWVLHQISDEVAAYRKWKGLA